MDIKTVSVIGAGAWGTALATHIGELGNKVTLWAFEEEVVEDINKNHQNNLFLKDVPLSKNITATSDLATATNADMVFFVAPSHVMAKIVENMVPHLKKKSIVVSCTKGIEREKLRLPSQIFDEYLPEEISSRLVCVSGPTFAAEVARGVPSAVTASSKYQAASFAVQKILSGRHLRVYTHDDIVGVEIGGVVKNVIAIAAGISDGLNYGLNTRAAIITRGLEEAVRLGQHMGADDKTFRGLSGIGDLVLTASGDLSRNRTVGLRLGKGESIKDIVAGMKMIAEGILTSNSLHSLSKKLKVEMPICDEVYYVCHENKDPRGSVEELFSRNLKEEFYE